VLAASYSAAAPKAYIRNFADNTVSVVDTTARRVIATVPVASGPHGMATTPDGRLVYVASDGSSVVNLIDTGTDKVIRTIEVGKMPHGLPITPDGHFPIAGVYGEDRLAFVDTGTQAIVGTVAVPKLHTGVRPDGKVAYVASQEPGNFALVVVDLSSPRAVIRKVALPKAPRDPEFGYDGKALYFTLAGANAVQVLDSESDKIVAEIPIGASPHIAAWFKGVVVVQGPGEILLFDPASNTAKRSVAVGKQPHWISAAPDGAKGTGHLLPARREVANRSRGDGTAGTEAPHVALESGPAFVVRGLSWLFVSRSCWRPPRCSRRRAPNRPPIAGTSPMSILPSPTGARMRQRSKRRRPSSRAAKVT
jgi:YVTN family beta-propeller protein